MLFRLVGMNDPHAHTNTAVVVGAGAAAKLADAGVATTLLEASSEVGGRAASKRQSGFDLNQGAYALYVGRPGMRQLRSLGIDPERWNPVSHRSVFLRAGRARRSPVGAAALARWRGSVLRHQPTGYVNGDLGVRMVSPTAGFLGIVAVQVQGAEIVAVRLFSNPERFGLTVLDGLSVPVVQAPMAGGPSTPELAAAVNRGGGLGFVAAGYLTPERLGEQLQRTAALTDRPFGVNLFVGSGGPG